MINDDFLSVVCILVFIVFLFLLGFGVSKQARANREAIERCAPYQMQTYDKEVTVCLSPEGYSVITNKEQ